MSVENIKKFNRMVQDAQQLLVDIKNAGSDVGQVLDIASKRGFSISNDDIEKATQETTGAEGAPEGLRAVVGAAVCAGTVVGPPVVVNAAVAV